MKRSQYADKYDKFMTMVKQDVHPREASEGSQQGNLLKRVHPSLYALRGNKYDMKLAYVGYNATIVDYIVDLGCFRMQIKVLNLLGRAPEQRWGLGDYGMPQINDSLRLKRPDFVKILWRSGYELNEAIKDVAITKLCARHKIAPNRIEDIPFDLIVYEDCIHIHLERMVNLKELPKFRQLDFHLLQQLESDILSCLVQLHKLHIVHKDIRPENILYDRKSERFVLCSFDHAEYLNQETWESTETTLCGMPRFMGPEMVNLIYKDGKGEVNLYFNDVHAWRQTYKILYVQHARKALKQHAQKSKNATSASQIAPLLLAPPIDQSASEEKQETKTSTQRLLFGAENNSFYRLVHAITSLTSFTGNFINLKDELTKVKKHHVQLLIQLSNLNPNHNKLGTFHEHLKEAAKTFNLPEAVSNRRFGESPKMTAPYVKRLGLLLGKEELERITKYLKNLKEDKDLLRLSDSSTEDEVESRIGLPHKTIGEKSPEQPYTEAQTNSTEEQQSMTVGDIVFRKINEPLIQPLISMIALLNKYPVTVWQLIHSTAFLTQYFFSYNTKEYLLLELHKIIVSNLPSSGKEYLSIFLSIQIGNKLPSRFFDYIQNEQSLERCVWLASYYFWISNDSTDRMMATCSLLFERLRQKPKQCFYLEIVNVKQTILELKHARQELQRWGVKSHFEECLQLLKCYSSHRDSKSILRLLGYQYYQYFGFPEEDIQAIHADIQNYSQFYCESLIDKGASVFVSNKLEKGSITSNSKLLHEFQQMRSKNPKRSEASMAEELLRSARSHLSLSSNPMLHRQLLWMRSNIFLSMGNYRQAQRSCREAIQINNKLAENRQKTLCKVSLLNQLAQFIQDQDRRGECLEILTGARRLLSNFPGEHTRLALNYNITASTLQVIGRLGESRYYCKQIIQMESQKKISESEAVLAHIIIVQICKKQNSPVELLQHMWMVLAKDMARANTIVPEAYKTLCLHCNGTVGSQLLSLIDSACILTNPPAQNCRGLKVEEAFNTPGKLSFEMTTEEFIASAEQLLRELTSIDHLSCFYLKRTLLRTVGSWVQAFPVYKLIYVRLGVQICLHRLILGVTLLLKEDIGEVIRVIEEYEVEGYQEEEKWLLIAFAKRLLSRIAKQCTSKVTMRICRNSLPAHLFIDKDSLGIGDRGLKISKLERVKLITFIKQSNECYFGFVLLVLRQNCPGYSFSSAIFQSSIEPIRFINTIHRLTCLFSSILL